MAAGQAHRHHAPEILVLVTQEGRSKWDVSVADADGPILPTHPEFPCHITVQDVICLPLCVNLSGVANLAADNGLCVVPASDDDLVGQDVSDSGYGGEGQLCIMTGTDSEGQVVGVENGRPEVIKGPVVGGVSVGLEGWNMWGSCEQ